MCCILSGEKMEKIPHAGPSQIKHNKLNIQGYVAQSPDFWLSFKLHPLRTVFWYLALLIQYAPCNQQLAATKVTTNCRSRNHYLCI
jgi:hypothetical protein